MTIKPLATLVELEKIIPLIQGYQEFYLKRSESPAKILKHFSRFLAPSEEGLQLGAWGEDGEALGFCTLHFIPSSLSCANYALMNDLFVAVGARGQGVGQKLVVAAATAAGERGFSTIDWITQQSNAEAQKLYDGLPTEKSSWLYYSLATGRK